MIYKEFEEKNIQSFEYETTINSNGKILGICELGKATIQLLNDNNEYSTFKESWIKTPHGSFYVYDVSPVQEKVNIKLDCYDIKYKLDTKYDSSKHSFPCTLKAWRNSIFDDCDVLYDNSDFPNSNLVLTKQPYVKDGASNRSVIAMIAEAGASTVITDSNDKFYFVWFNNTTHNVIDWLSLTTEKTKSSAINCVVLGRGEVEDNVSYPTEKPSNPVEFRIDNNYVLDPQDTTSQTDLRYETIIPVYNRINGFSYLIFNIRTQNVNNKLSIKLGDNVKFKDIFGNELIAPIMSKKITYLGGNFEEDNNFEITLSASEVKESSTDLSYSSSVENDIVKVSRKTDLNNMTIQDIINAIGADGEVTSASIILAINNDTSAIKLNANKIGIDAVEKGNVIASINASNEGVQILASKLGLTAQNVIDIIAGNEINIASKNISIRGNNLLIDKNKIELTDNGSQNNAVLKILSSIANAYLYSSGINIQNTSEGNSLQFFGENEQDPSFEITLWNDYILRFSVSGLNVNNRITTPKITAGNIDCGTCTLKSSGTTWVPFNKTFDSVPKVVITPNTSASGAISPKIRAVYATGFDAIIGGSGFSNIDCDWIAISS